MLIVLGVLGIVTAVVIPQMTVPRALAGPKLVADDLAQALIRARTRAIVDAQSVRVAIDVQHGILTGAGLEPVQVPASLRLDLETSESETVSPSVGGVRFYPDGSSSGLTLRILEDGTQAARITVNWLTGRVTVNG